MPWDDTTLYVAELEGERVINVAAVAGGGRRVGDGAESGRQTGRSISSRTAPASGTSMRCATARLQPMLPMDAEFAGPLWGLGQSNYVIMGDGRIVASYGDADGDHLVVIDRGRGARDPDGRSLR